MTWLGRLFERREDPRDALLPLWQAIVAEARQPRWFARGGVADSKEGRFDMVALVTALAMLRLERSPDLVAASARLTECFVADMEGQLRQEGIGDPGLGKRVGKLVGALGGRIGALREALDEGGDLTAMIVRNTTFAGEGDTAWLAGEARELAARLAALDDTRMLAGELG